MSVLASPVQFGVLGRVMPLAGKGAIPMVLLCALPTGEQCLKIRDGFT